MTLKIEMGSIYKNLWSFRTPRLQCRNVLSFMEPVILKKYRQSEIDLRCTNEADSHGQIILNIEIYQNRDILAYSDYRDSYARNKNDV